MIKLKTLAENTNIIKGEYKYIDIFIGNFFIMSSVPKENLYSVCTLDLYISHSFIDDENLYIELKAKVVED